jgi:predicted transcriptional regulator of viral defense system
VTVGETNRRGYPPLPTCCTLPGVPSSDEKRLLASIRKLGVVRPSDLESRGVPRARLYGLVRRGLLERIGRGLYIAEEHGMTESHSLAMVAKRTPSAVVCLLSALQFHVLTTQLPHEVWIAIGEKARRPRIAHPRLRVMRFSATTLTAGVEVH